jgi:hypothetical protein
MLVSFRSRIVINLEVNGVDSRDYPDFCDAYFSYAEWEDGTPLTDTELDRLTDERGDIVNAMAYDAIV